MFDHKNKSNLIATAVCFSVWVVLLVLIPFKTIISENHTSFSGLDAFRYIGLSFVVICSVLDCWCFWNFIRRAKGTPLPLGSQEFLMTNGLYRYVRNPMYVLGTLILLGETLFFQSVNLFFFTIVLVIVLHVKTVFVEEPALKLQFGESYERYCKDVNRWVSGRSKSI